MSGHSKWSTIKRKKGAADAKRGKIFTRLTREIVIAAREGGGDVDSNFSLRLAVDRARAENMPKDNIERAIRRGTGEDKDGASYEEGTYEGYGPNGIAFLISVLTDNRNRTVADLRHTLTKFGGSMGESGSVAWQFSRKGFIHINANDWNYDAVFMIAVEAGAEDVTDDGETIEILTDVEYFKEINTQLEDAGIQPTDRGLRMVPEHELELPPDDTLKIMNVIEALEDLDDVQDVYSNLSISDEALAQLA